MKKLLLLCAVVGLSHLSFGWGQNGHRITAQICYDNLSDAAREKIDAALNNDFLTQVATWPDYIRSEKNWDFAKNWHFITINPGKSAADVVNQPKKKDTIRNVVEAIELMTAILKGDQDRIDFFQKLMEKNKVQPLGGSVEATAIAFLVHFIGDVHQPMHCGKNNDHGGNSISVLFFDEKTNLHSVWDEGIIEQEGLSYTEFSAFINKHEYPNIATYQKMKKATDWADESVTYREKIYNTLYNNTDYATGLPKLKYEYQHDFITDVEERLAAGGYRAAALFNSIYK